MGTHPSRLALVAALLPIAAATAQQRKPCFVTVADARDRPLAGATVTLTGSGPTGPGTADVVVGTTDERGRCRPAVLVGRLYTIAAIGPAAPDGARLVTEPTDRGACGAVVELCAMHRWTPRRVRVAPSEELRSVWSPGLHVLDAGARTTALLPVDAEGFAALPPAPWTRLRLGIRDAAGALLQIRHLEPTSEEPTLTFHAPAPLHVRVLGPDGAAAADAHVAANLGDRAAGTDRIPLELRPFASVRLASGDANGDLTLRSGAPTHEYVTWLAVGAAGCATTWLLRSELESGSPAAPVTLRLEAERHLRGRLRGVGENEIVAALAAIEVHRGQQHGLQNTTYGIVVPLDLRPRR